MDFLQILPDEISERIFNKLDTSSFLDCFRVSSSWNNFLSSSINFKRRFTLDLRQLKYNDHFEMISKTQREFTDATFYIYRSEKLKERMEMTQDLLKKLQIKRIRLEMSFLDCSTEEFQQYLKMFEGCLDDLKIQLVTINDVTDESEINVDLSSLKSIYIVQGGNLNFMLKVASQAKNLTSLTLGGLQMFDKIESSLIHDLFKNLKYLKQLHIDYEWSELFFKQTTADYIYPFVLKDLVIFVGQNELHSFEKFLNYQKNIEKLHVINI
jgi:hypothetical protein